MTARQTRVIDDVNEAAAILRSGGLVAFPTETVFGLGVDATNDEAIEKLFWAKGRPSDNPLIVHLADLNQWELVASTLPPVARELLEQFAPGPLTTVVPKQTSISMQVTAGLKTVGLRIPDHELARSLIRAAGIPVAAPSANRSGKPSGTTWQTVLEDLDGRIDAVVRGQTCAIGIESTVVDCVSHPPRMLRPGAISLQQLRSVVPDVEALHPSEPSDAAMASPGIRHPHYQPHAMITLVENSHEAERLIQQRAGEGDEADRWYATSAYCGLDDGTRPMRFGMIRQFENLADYARGLYEFMRSVDRQGLSNLYCQRPAATHADSQLYAALLDRLERAASPKG